MLSLEGRTEEENFENFKEYCFRVYHFRFISEMAEKIPNYIRQEQISWVMNEENNQKNSIRELGTREFLSAEHEINEIENKEEKIIKGTNKEAERIYGNVWQNIEKRVMLCFLWTFNTC